MANRTVKDATSIKGTNPQYLVEKIIRSRIYDSRYWKEECFALTAELLVDKAMQLKYVGGVFGGNIKPTPFLCLVLKMLQIQPEKDIIIEFIKNENFKYVRALGAYYMRLTGTSLDCYKYLEPLLNDYRKLRSQDRQGVFELTFMDEFIDNLLREERICDVILPRIQRRQVHEETGELEVRVSALDDDLDELAESSGDEELEPPTTAISPPPQPPASSGRHRRSASRERNRDGWRRRDTAADFRPGPEYPSGYLRHEPYRELREHRHPPPERDHHHPAEHVSSSRHHRSSDHHRSEKRHHRGDDTHGERREKRHRREGRDDVVKERARDGRREVRDGRDAEKESRRGERRSHREPRGERRERRERGDRGGDEKRERGRHRDQDQRREIEEANALRAKLGLPPLRP